MSDDLWVNAVIEVRVPLDVAVDASDEEKRKEAEATIDYAVDSEDPPEGVLVSVGWEIAGPSTTGPPRKSEHGIDQTVPNVTLYRALVQETGNAYGFLNGSDTLTPDEYDEIGVTLQTATMAARELAARLRADLASGNGHSSTLDEQLEKQLRAEAEAGETEEEK